MQALKPLLQGQRETVVRAETGSGKTFAFLLPILEAIQAAGGPDAITDQVVGLIIVPTADLVQHPPPRRASCPAQPDTATDALDAWLIR